jgi:hypothetical protein
MGSGCGVSGTTGGNVAVCVSRMGARKKPPGDPVGIGDLRIGAIVGGGLARSFELTVGGCNHIPTSGGRCGSSFNHGADVNDMECSGGGAFWSPL